MFVLITSFLMIGQTPGISRVEIPAGYSRAFSESDFQDLDVLEIGELEMGKGSSLELPAFKSIRIRKLYASEGSRIELARAGSGADGEDGVDGGAGADTHFFVDEINGHVVIEARGGDGGQGRDGRRGQQGVSGAKGRDGVRFYFFYLSSGDRGQTGGPGEDGEDGQDGGRGGDGGRAKVYFVNKAPQAQILVDVSGGRGGRGGRAGHGGLGGAGGPGGQGTSRGPQGFMGPNGKPGVPGRPGAAGSPGAVSIYQVDSVLYGCLLEVEFVFGEFREEEWTRCLSRG